MAEITPKFIVGLLERSPDVALKLGVLMGEFSVLEFLLIAVMGRVLGEDSRNTMANEIMGLLQSVALRVSVIEACARNLEDKNLKTNIKEAMSLAININRIRNEYAHSMYMIHTKDQTVQRNTWGFSKNRTTKSTLITPDSIEKDIVDVRVMNGKIMALIIPEQIVNTLL